MELFKHKEGTDKFYDVDVLERIVSGSNLPYDAKEIIYNVTCEMRDDLAAAYALTHTPAKSKKKSDGKDDLG